MEKKSNYTNNIINYSLFIYIFNIILKIQLILTYNCLAYVNITEEEGILILLYLYK